MPPCTGKLLSNAEQKSVALTLLFDSLYKSESGKERESTHLFFVSARSL